MTRRRVARVLLDSPLPQLDRLFDYAIPDELADDAVPGVRVRVPLRTAGRVVDAYLVELADESSARSLSEMDAVVSPVRVLTPALYALARRAADRAAGSASDILRLVIPKRMVRAEKIWRAAGPASPTPPAAATRARAEEELAGFPGLADALARGERRAVSAPPHTRTLDGDEVGAWAMLLAASAVRVLAEGRSAVLAVPDHRDRAQLERALGAFSAELPVIRDDAAQSGPERYAAYLRMLEDAPCIVVGNRSSVYAPASHIGLIAVWDDGDSLLAEPLSPGVHARDAALLRADLDGCALLLAGHTRTADVQRLVELGWVHEAMPARRTSPRIVLTEPGEGTASAARIPPSAFAAARDALAHGPVLVQVARPGYAPSLVCGQCRAPARCLHCGGPLRAARPGVTPTCAWCGRAATGWRCGVCDAASWRMASSGSERTADELGRAFAGTRVIVADGAHPVLHVSAEPALVVATRGAEPLASGGYRAVLLLDGERMLLSDDLRAGESALRWWSNAAALAAPGAPVHLAGVAGPVARALATWMQPAYAAAQLRERAPLKMPPTVRVATLEGPGAAVRDALAQLRVDVPDLASDAVLGPVDVAEPPGSARALVRFEYGRGAIVTSSLRAALVQAALRTRRAKGRGAARNTLRVRVDVPDPIL